jgi:WD40 repeat protein/serine/threonine protein kinase
MDSPAQALVGKEIRGYHLQSLIAQGGFGQVYRAHQASVDRDVAIKVIHPQYASQPQFVRRFELEAQLVAQLEHPHIVPLIDYWRDPEGAYLVMRLLRGGSLTDLMDRLSGPLPLDLSARMLDQIAAALTLAHRNGIIHRDMKPANVLLDVDRNAYLADFGIAKRLFMEEESDFERFGSPAYVAPEQVASDVVSAQTDIYSLGIILFEMLTGTLPFNAPSQTLMLQAHLTAEVPSLTAVRPDLPEEANYVIRRATQRLPKDRYADAMAMAQDFRRLVLGREDGAATSAPTPSRPRSSGDSAGKTMILNIAAVAQKNPYKGLRAFQEADSVDFFGREAVINRLVARLRSSGHTSRFLALVGPSGSGKSSLARAGLVSSLRRGGIPGSKNWYYVVMTPGAHPFVELEQALARVATRLPENLSEKLHANPERIGAVLDALLPPNIELVLVIDQFEEVFGSSNEAIRDAFLNTLAALTHHPRARLIITLRADYYDRPLLHPVFGGMLRDCTEVVLPLSAAEMEAAIVKPAERLGVAFEPGLVTRMIQDVSAQSGALPLLQYVLYELFEARTSEVLSLRAYENEGGVYGALARRAETLYHELTTEGKRAAQRLFLRLVNVGEGSDDSRRRITRMEALGASAAAPAAAPPRDTKELPAVSISLSTDNPDNTATRILGGRSESSAAGSSPPRMSPAETVLEKFGQHRLLTFDRDSLTRTPTVEIAHESLIRYWDRLREWINADRVLLRLRQTLIVAALEWEKSGREAGYLARGGRLASFETLRDSENIPLDIRETAYLTASIAARDGEARRARRSTFALAGVAILAVLAAVFALVLQSEEARQRALAQRNADLQQSNALALQARSSADQLDLSLLLSIEALAVADTPGARGGLLESLQQSPRLQTFLHGAQSSLRAIATSPDGQYAAAGSSEGTLYLWDLSNRSAPPRSIEQDSSEINALAFSPNGSLLASVGAEGQLRFWDVETLAASGSPITAHDVGIRDVAWSPDGSVLATAGEDGSIRLWDAETGVAVGEPLLTESEIVYAVAFSPDGALLASGGDDGLVSLWNAESGERIASLQGHRNWVLDVAWSHDGTLLASSGADGAVLFWDANNDFATVGQLLAHQEWVRAIAFSTDDRVLASASADDTLRLWRMSDGAPLADPLIGHTDDVWGVAFAPDGTLISAGRDGRALLWAGTTAGAAPIGSIQTQAQPLTALAYSAALDGLAIGVRGAEDGAVALLLNRDGSERFRLFGNGEQTIGLAFLPSGVLLAITDTADLLSWSFAEASAGSRLDATPIANLESIPYVLAVSPDGTRAAVGGDSSEVIIFEVSGDGTPLARIETGASAVLALAFSPDGAALIVGDARGRVSWWATNNWTQQGESTQVAQSPISALAFTPEGRTLAIGARNGELYLYDALSRAPLGEPLIGHEDWITALQFLSSDTLASSGQDRQVRVWRLNAGEELSLVGHRDWATGVAWLPEGALLSVGRDRQLISWTLAVETWRARACATANRNLTPAEWQDFMGDAQYRETCGS